MALALSRHHRLTTAAKHLDATHTTVARRLKAFERQLGVRLFDQTPEGYVPTDAGQDVVAVAEKVEADLLALEARVLGGDERLQGKLRVTTMDVLFRAHHSAFTSFTARYPGVELTIAASDREASLTRREADVALRMTKAPPPNLVGRKVGHIDFAVYASKSLVARQGRKATYADYPWIHWDERLEATWLDGWLSANAPKAPIALRVDFSSLGLHEAIAAGVGVHFLACYDGDADPRLQRIGRVDTTFRRDLWLLTLPELRHTSRIRAFMTHVADYFGAQRSR